MSHSYKLSLRSAILINVNIMFGTGLFINTISLAKQTGFLGFLSYAMVALLIAPLIIGFGHLFKIHPAGGFYEYASKEISSLAGFVSSWSYFIGKLASAALLIHVFSTLLVSLLPDILTINPLMLDVGILALFAWFNLYNFKTGRIVMYTFLVFKVTPILFVILASLYLIKFWSIPEYSLLWSGIPSSIPLVLYAFTGFEACCSLSSVLKNPADDGPRAIAFSYIAVVITTIVYQLLFFLALGPTLMQQQSSLLGVFPPLLQSLWHSYPGMVYYAQAFIHSAIAVASLGGSYGILLSNHWNLYTLAQHKHLFFNQTFTRLNRFGIPAMGIMIEALICLLYLVLCHHNIALFQQIAVLGCTIAFALSMIALNCALQRKTATTRAWPLINAWLSMGSCALFFAFSLRSFIVNGIGSLYLFATLFLIGLGMYWITDFYKNSLAVK